MKYLNTKNKCIDYAVGALDSKNELKIMDAINNLDKMINLGTYQELMNN